MDTARIAVVDDDPNISHIVSSYLKKEGFQVFSYLSAEEAEDHLSERMPDLWVLDVMLPGSDGFDFCQRIRRKSEAPIIFISAKDEEVDKVLGLELGSDDYMTKPFSPRELVARVKRHLKRWERMKRMDAAVSSDMRVSLGKLDLDRQRRLVYWEGSSVEVTHKEYEFLDVMVRHQNRAMARAEILQAVWGEDYYGSDRAVDDLVKRIRQKMEGFPLLTVWGYGYRLVEEHGSGI